jgi:hypothetical protein
MRKKEAYPHTEQLAFYDKLIESLPNMGRKGVTMPYTSVNGNMFSFLDKDGNLGLRLPEKERIDFLTEHDSVLCEAHGTVLKEYVLVPLQLLKDTEKMQAYFKTSFAYINSLKPKATK